jgi:hypothetical protein
LLKKHGFRPVLESDVFPNDLKSDYCLALQCEVTAKGFLKTTVTVSLKDCNNNIIFETEGTTKEKDFDKVYAYGIRKAFENFKDLKYNYVPKKTSANASAEKAKEIKDNADEVEQLKAEIEELKKAKELKINEQASQKEQELKPIVEDKSKNIKTNNIYFEAIAIDNGYNLVNAENKKVIHVLTKTGMDNVFTVKGNNGIVYKKDGKWMLEYTKGKKTVVEIINIIF